MSTEKISENTPKNAASHENLRLSSGAGIDTIYVLQISLKINMAGILTSVPHRCRLRLCFGCISGYKANYKPTGQVLKTGTSFARWSARHVLGVPRPLLAQTNSDMPLYKTVSSWGRVCLLPVL